LTTEEPLFSGTIYTQNLTFWIYECSENKITIVLTNEQGKEIKRKKIKKKNLAKWLIKRIAPQKENSN